MDDERYVLLDDLLKVKEMKNVSVDTVKRIVNGNDKQRFSMAVKNGKICIRANQGHSKQIGDKIDDEKACEKILVPLDICVHGTTLHAFKFIEKDGLRPQSRKHIHFAKGLPGDDAVISGARNTSQIFIFIDMKKAMDDGIEFFMSDNGVILSEGKDGKIGCEYFKETFNTKK